MKSGTKDFYCDRCGRCCAGLGKTITILGNPSPGQYRFLDRITRENRVVRASCISSHAPCPFLSPGEVASCRIYQERPNVCRDFRCYDLAIVAPAGHIIARVKGTGLLSSDPVITALFKSLPAPEGETDHEAWLDSLRKLFQKEGYRVCG